MTANGWLQIALFFAAVLLVTKPLGVFMARVFSGERTFLDPILRPIERGIYWLTGVDASREMRWTEYAASLLAFSVVSMLVLYLMQRLQAVLPFNPQGLAAVPPALAFNTAASFTTNTNWQAYVGETTMSYLTQMAGLAYHNFVSAAAGIALAIAFVRGIASKGRETIGNFWVDMTRASLWVLLPICLVGALVLVSQGVVQNLRPYDRITTLEASNGSEQLIAQGPVASQEVIKELGTNGGGFFNANSAHPFENPTPLTNFFELVMIFAISSGLTYTLGRMTGAQKHGWAVWGAMAFLFLAGVTTAYWSEARGNPILAGTDQHASALQAGGNMEGKECRFGIANSALFATVTTAASCGAVNGMHDSFTPLGGMVPLVNIMLGEVIFGGVGAGLYGMLVFVVLAVLILCATILTPAAVSMVSSFGTSSLNNSGPHGLSEILYAFVSATGNNGSAFAGLNANTDWYNVSLGIAMLFGRFFMIIPVLALAGSLARKTPAPPSSGTFPVTTPLFAGLLVCVVIIVGALTFFPALSLGPIVEHLSMTQGKTF